MTDKGWLLTDGKLRTVVEFASGTRLTWKLSSWLQCRQFSPSVCVAVVATLTSFFQHVHFFSMYDHLCLVRIKMFGYNEFCLPCYAMLGDLYNNQPNWFSLPLHATACCCSSLRHALLAQACPTLQRILLVNLRWHGCIKLCLGCNILPDVMTSSWHHIYFR